MMEAHRPTTSASPIQLLHVRRVLLPIAVPGPQLEEGRHRRRRGHRRRLPEAAVVRVALGERPVGVRPGRGVRHGGVGQALVVCFSQRRETRAMRDRRTDGGRETTDDRLPEALTVVDDGVRGAVCVGIVVICGEKEQKTVTAKLL